MSMRGVSARRLFAIRSSGNYGEMLKTALLLITPRGPSRV